MKKVDKNFVCQNKKGLVEKTFQNAKRLFSDAKVLRERQSFSSSLFLSISALEELAKWHFLQKEDYEQLGKICDHKFKLETILEIFREVSGNQKLQKEDSAWLRNNRLKEMREDVLYVRLCFHTDQTYPVFPDEKYWQKRAKAIIQLLEIIFNYYRQENHHYQPPID